MSDAPKLESILSVAMEYERNYGWVEAVQFCEKALGLKPKDFFLKLCKFRKELGLSGWVKGPGKTK
jgi:hypothetical protein